MENIEELEKKLNTIEKACDNVWEEFMNMSTKNIPYDVANKWYSNQPVIKERELIQDKIRQLKKADEFEPIEWDDDVYTIEKFKGICKSVGFIDYDGFGVYAYKDKKSNIEIYPSDVQKGNVRSDFTHVVWYNR